MMQINLASQSAEAERLVAAWEPNPAECELEGAQVGFTD